MLLKKDPSKEASINKRNFKTILINIEFQRIQWSR